MHNLRDDVTEYLELYAMPTCRPSCGIECRRRQNDYGADWTLSLEIPAMQFHPV